MVLVSKTNQLVRRHAMPAVSTLFPALNLITNDRPGVGDPEVTTSTLRAAQADSAVLEDARLFTVSKRADHLHAAPRSR